MKQQNSKKAEATRTRILDAALAVFQECGFEKATMRDVASAAEVAVGAAYYYFPSKDAIVMAFYERAQEEMSAAITEALAESRTFEQRISAIIGSKLRYFQEYQLLLGALSAHTDPQHPLSPFSEETKKIREKDISHFEAAVNDSKIKLPGSVKMYFPRLLWLYQMGVILFWVYDQSTEQSRTKVVLEKTLKMMVLGLRL